MNKYEEKLIGYARITELALEKSVPSLGEPTVCEAMRYALLGGGKRIRAALVLEFATMYGATQEEALPFACAIEMVHAYSLIHDDLPCMDDDDMRRGKPSCHKQFGEATALLAGDALLTLAFEMIAEAPLSSEQRISAVALLAKAAGSHGMIGGQMLDLQAEQKKISLDNLQQLYRWKTGALLSCAAQMGCIIGNVNTTVQKAVEMYMATIGLLFQVTDDILDIVGDTSVLGKPVGSDMQQEKNTYTSLLGIEGARQAAQTLAEQARLQAQDLKEPGFLLWLAELLITRDH